MHFIFRLLPLLLVATAALPAFAESSSVRVAIPSGLTASSQSTSDSKSEGMKYVTVDGVRLMNPSRQIGQAYRRDQFHLLAQGRAFTPVVRPGLDAIDLHEASLLGPDETALVTVTFLVPDKTTMAKFEFTPHWMSDDGRVVDWCCYYL